MRRPTWDEYFVDLVPLIARRSTCLRHHIGAVITVDNQIVTTGYNGPPKGCKHCDELGGCLRDREKIPSGTRHERCRAAHAEQNAIIQAAVRGISIKGGTLYTTYNPCMICSRAIINAQLRRVVFYKHYPDEMGWEMLEEAGIELSQIICTEDRDDG
jgi:dCMP deaminase